MVGTPVHGPPVLSRILLVGQAPGPREASLGRPFAWTAGRTLFRWLEQATGASAQAAARVEVAISEGVEADLLADFARHPLGRDDLAAHDRLLELMAPHDRRRPAVAAHRDRLLAATA